MTPRVARILLFLREGELNSKEIAEAADTSVPYVDRVNQRYGYIRPQRRRFLRAPEEWFEKFEALIRDTEMSIWACLKKVGFRTESHRMQEIVARHRRYVAQAIWVDQTTGELKPKQHCGTACIVQKTGLSAKTIQRRIRDGIINPAGKMKSNRTMLRFSDTSVRTLLELGRNPGDKNAVITRADVRKIRRLAARGKTHGAIQREDYPQISRRQISRIVNRTRWKNVR
jgi:hypothetical protein